MLRYAVTIFLSAFLLFLVQPMIGKYILPWFGGAAGVWAACLVFFQTALLAGYAYAFAIDRWLSPRRQMIVHLILLLAAAGLLWMMPPDDAWKPTPDGQPAFQIIVLLTACLGVPYIALAATGPLLQAWFARSYRGRSPYRLYALSNAGSLLALLGYPFVFEPVMTRLAQVMMWSGGFVAFAGICGWCAVAQRNVNTFIGQHANAGSRSSPGADRTGRQITVFDRVMWFALPACASILLLSITTRITQDVAPIPFLWVVPLAVYLITFIVAFEKPVLYWRPLFAVLLLLALGAVLALMLKQDVTIIWQLIGYMFVLFVCCMICHGEVYRLRPPPESGKLTAFYLLIAAGGAAGGAFVSLACPLLFNTYVEFHVGLFGTVALLMACVFNDQLLSHVPLAQRRMAWLIMLLVVAAVGLGMRVAVTELERGYEKHIVLRARNFYGALAIRVHPAKDERFGEWRSLEHGRITHGAQIMNPVYKTLPVLYYGQQTGVGLVMHYQPHQGPRRVGVVGLGTGTLAAWGRPGDLFRFYEINPLVIDWAGAYFTYLEDTPAVVEIIPGDARLSLEREENQNYDVLVLDAFSGDAIPIHLLTKEAFDVYMRHLHPQGILAVHVSNRYVELHPVVQRVGLEVGLKTVFVFSPADEVRMNNPAHWVLLSRDDAVFKNTPIRVAAEWPRGIPHVRLWVDEYASLLQVLRRRDVMDEPGDGAGGARAR